MRNKPQTSHASQILHTRKARTGSHSWSYAHFASKPFQCRKRLPAATTGGCQNASMTAIRLYSRASDDRYSVAIHQCLYSFRSASCLTSDAFEKLLRPILKSKRGGIAHPPIVFFRCRLFWI